MRRFLLDTGIAGCFIDRRRGVFERAQSEILLGNWVGIGHPVLAELAYRVEGSPNRDRNLQRLHLALASPTESYPTRPLPASVRRCC